MRPYWLFFLLWAGPLTASAQTIVRSMQTVNNDKELSVNVVGTQTGRPFRHQIRYDVTGLTKAQRDSLYAESVQALATLGITNVPGLQKPGLENAEGQAATQTGVVTITCVTCQRKGQLELYGSNYLHTRMMNPKGEPQKRFPVTMRLGPDQYRLVYKQRGHQPVEVPFVLSIGEAKQLTIP